MRWLEVRRHSVTKRSRGTGSHVSQEGVALARLVGSTLEPFASVVTSAAPRAIETALAMGYGVDETVDLPSGYLPGQLAHHDQWHWPQPYRRYAELLALARVGRGRQSSPCPLGPTHRRRTGWRRRDGPVVRAARLSERGSGSLQARGYGFESRWLQLRSVTGSKPFLSKSGRMATSGLSFGLSCPRLSPSGSVHRIASGAYTKPSGLF